MHRLLLLLALIAPACGTDEKSSTTTDTGTTADTTGTSTAAGTTAGTSGSPTTTSGTTGALPDGSCRTQTDCENFEQCEPPGSVQCGGATGCVLDGVACSDDPSCGGTPEAPQICAQDPCCGMGVCQPGCLTDADCGLAQQCGADARCTVASCDPQTPCPANFSCVANSCAPTSCSGDAMCDDYCVNGLCSAGLGTCISPAA